MFINDLFRGGGPGWGDQSLWKRMSHGHRVSIGTNATALPVTLVDDVLIGAGAVVTHDILESSPYSGSPAHKIRTL